MSTLLTRPIVLIMMNNGLGYASIHVFYPNISKFFQSRFNFSMVQAGFISSIPYTVSSLSVPFIGGMISYLGEAYFEFMLFSTVSAVLSVHLFYLAINDVTDEGTVG